MNPLKSNTGYSLTDTVLGVVVCGGESKRMGSDKGLLPLRGTARTWAQQVAGILSNCNLPLVISINKTQVASYSLLFPSEQLILDQGIGGGPLNGLLSVHQKYPGKDLLLLGCDMIRIDQATLNHLLTIYQEHPTFDYYIHEQDGFFEPLCAIYSSKALDEIIDRLNAHELTSFALHKIISSSNYKSIPVTDKKPFSNYNTTDVFKSFYT